MKRTPNVERVLRTLLDGPSFGLQIARDAGMHDETVYRVLWRMRDEGWVNVIEGTVRTYSLTDAGYAVAREWFRPTPERVSRYRRRGTYVEAICWLGANWEAVSEFVGLAVYRDGDVLWIATPDAPERAPLGYWVIRGVKNFFPVDQETFDAMFEVP